MEIMTIIFSMVSFVLSIISMLIGIAAFIELRSFMKSTHKVDFLPLENSVPLEKEHGMDDDLKKYGLL